MCFERPREKRREGGAKTYVELFHISLLLTYGEACCGACQRVREERERDREREREREREDHATR
jgi:hypothetical protein